MIDLIRAELALAGKPLTIRELRRANPALAKYRSMSQALSDGMKWGFPRVTREFVGNEWFYTVENIQMHAASRDQFTVLTQIGRK